MGEEFDVYETEGWLLRCFLVLRAISPVRCLLRAISPILSEEA